MNINQSLVKDFTSKLDGKELYKDIMERYKITNIAEDDEAWYGIVDTLYRDYENGRANYKGYISKGMNARLLMEIRNSMILDFGEYEEEFIKNHKDLNTVEEVRAYRTKFIQQFIPDFTGVNWQLYMILKYTLRNKANDIDLCFECCYEDGDWKKQERTDWYMLSIRDNYAWKPWQEDSNQI